MVGESIPRTRHYKNTNNVNNKIPTYLEVGPAICACHLGGRSIKEIYIFRGNENIFSIWSGSSNEASHRTKVHSGQMLSMEAALEI